MVSYKFCRHPKNRKSIFFVLYCFNNLQIYMVQFLIFFVFLSISVEALHNYVAVVPERGELQNNSLLQRENMQITQPCSAPSSPGNTSSK